MRIQQIPVLPQAPKTYSSEQLDQLNRTLVTYLNKLVLGLASPEYLSDATAVTSNYTLLTTDTTLFVNTTGGNVTVTLLPAAGFLNRRLAIKRLTAGANTLTVAADGAELIDGSGTLSLPTQYDSVILQSYNGAWWIL